MRYISPEMLSENMTVVHVSPHAYDWKSQSRDGDEESQDRNWLFASGSTATSTVTGNLLDSDEDDDQSYD